MNFDRPKNWEAVQKMEKRKHFFLVYFFLGFHFSDTDLVNKSLRAT